MAAEGSSDLDALLDDALEGFGRAETRRAPATAAAVAAAAPVPSAPQPQAAKDTDAPGSSGRSAGGRQGLAFDPLPRRKAAAAAAAGSASGAQAPASGGGSEPASTPGLDVLSEGLSKLLAELAQAEGEGAPDDSSAGGAAAAGVDQRGAAAASDEQQQQQQQQQQQERRQQDLHATLRALSDQAPSFAAGEPNTEEEMMRLLAEHLGALGGGGGGGGGGEGGDAGDAGGPGAGAGGQPEMSSLVDSIMHQLLSKEVLYQPMKDIGERYPGWLAANKDTLSADDYGRYEQQYGYIQRICALYEASPSDFPQLVELLQAMQQCGQPPQEIVDELAPGMQFGSDGLPGFGVARDDLPPGLADCAIHLQVMQECLRASRQCSIRLPHCSVMDIGAWGCQGPAQPLPPPESRMRDAGAAAGPLTEFEEFELSELGSRALRILLAAPTGLPHSQLRALLSRGGSEVVPSSRSKCLLELAVSKLLEQGLVVRQGYGAWAALTVPDAALPRAEALAFSEFPDEGQLPLYAAGSGAAHRRGSCLRRHSSPRQFGTRTNSRMSGIEKASGGRRSKRSFGEDVSGQLQKKLRMFDDSSFGSGAAAAAAAAVPLCSSPFSPGGAGMMAMSP